MKNVMSVVLVWFVCFSLLAATVVADEMSNFELTERITKLEKEVGIESGEPGGMDRITISGALEAEAGFSSTEFNDPGADDVDESDIVLATVELGIDAEIHKHVSGHLLLLWEEDDTDPIDVDEGYITIDGKDVVPLYMNAGKLYLPFGNFESHMITDPVTLDLGETGQSAVQVGFANDMIDASLAIYNGDVDESSEDNVIGSYAAGISFSLPEDTIPSVGLSAGISYISNIADTDGMEGIVQPNADDEPEIVDNVAGFGAFISISFMEMVTVEAEYISAMDKFDANDLTYTTEEVEPSVWNLELAVAPTENLEVAVRYAQTDDFIGGIEEEVLPETQYGLTVAYGVFDGTAVAIEYLKNEFENDDEATVITAQLAIEF
jgi:hypothetical protein